MAEEFCLLRECITIVRGYCALFWRNWKAEVTSQYCRCQFISVSQCNFR